eukprot:scaffold135491_cov33-Tisochrysis_lutea.AAC.3
MQRAHASPSQFQECRQVQVVSANQSEEAGMENEHNCHSTVQPQLMAGMLNVGLVRVTITDERKIVGVRP